MKKEFKGFIGAVAIVCAFSLLTFGCARPVQVGPAAPIAADPPNIIETAPPHAAWEPAQIWPGPAAEELLADTGDRNVDLAVLEGRTSASLFPVYFDFDRSNIRPDQTERITKNGNFMLDNLLVRVRIEGNADERGTREYNLALGERRAMSAKKYLMDLGVTAGRLETISFGEERPICFESDESCWSLNRRADFVILR
ncbi:MAG: peptidoglycan-associated lipoprotein Pal [Desulfobulbaceae bacterium]|nr:MAG: peptidoglycan-associated lipoprotein Pal [Desulfobulbaceae bacterium]